MPQGLAGDVSGVSLSNVLAGTLARAAEHARSRKHRQISLEHLLLALTDDEEAAAVLAACNVDIGGLHQNIAGFLDQLEGEDAPGQADPVVAIELKRILDYAAAAALQGGRSHVNGAIVLAAMIGEGRSRAASFLQAQGLTFESAVRVLQEQSQVQRPAPKPSGNGARTPQSAEEILATARERVASRGGHVRARPQLPVSEPEAEAGSSENAAGRPPWPSLEDEAAAAGDAASRSSTVGGLPPRNADAGRPGMQRQGAGPPPLPQLRAGQRATTEPPVGTRGVDGVAPTRPPLPAWMKQRQGKVQGPRQHIPPLPSAVAGGASRLSPAEIAVAGSAPARDVNPEWTPDLPVAEKPAAKPGELIENIPRRMTVGLPETVELRISRDETETTVHGAAGPIQQKRFIAKAVSARLRSSDGLFVIEASSPETQWIEAAIGALSAEFVVWRFTVTPTRRGEGVLQIVIASRTLGTDGVTAETVLPERHVAIRVRPSYRSAARRVLGWISALLIGILLGGLGQGLFDNVIGLLRRAAG